MHQSQDGICLPCPFVRSFLGASVAASISAVADMFKGRMMPVGIGSSHHQLVTLHLDVLAFLLQLPTTADWEKSAE